MRVVLQNTDAVALRDVHEGIHVRRIAEHMYHDDGLRPRRDARLDVLRARAQCARIQIAEDRRGTEVHQLRVRGPERPGRRDDLIAATDAQTVHRTVDRRCAVVGGQRKLRALPLGILRLQQRGDIPAGHGARMEHVEYGLLVLLGDDRPCAEVR